MERGRSPPIEGRLRSFKILMVIILMSSSIPSFLGVRAENPRGMVINEVLYDPLGSEAEGEWIELYNVGAQVYVKEWTLTDQDGTEFRLPDLTIPSHGFLLIYISSGNITYKENTIILYMNRTSSLLNNNGDDLLLLDSLGNAVDYVSYGSGSAVDCPIFPLNWIGTNKTVSEGFSYSLMPDGEDLDSDANWAEAIPSPGTFNSADESNEVLITEVYYDAYRDNEYIKLYNPSNEDLDLGGWSLTDFEGTAYFPPGSILKAGDDLTIAENSTSYHEDTLLYSDYQVGSGNAVPMIISGIFRLKNDGDELLLRNRASEAVDVFCYGASNYSGDGWTGSCTDPIAKGKIAKRQVLSRHYLDTNTSEEWTNLREYGIGQSSFQVEAHSGSGGIEMFTSPDNSFEVVANAIDNARSTIHISLYKFTSWLLAEHLEDALERGVAVEVLLEGGMVAGFEDDEKYIMKLLAERGGKIQLMINEPSSGIHERYPYMHAKYAVIDEEVSIVTSENWSPSGVPKDSSYGNRGWGIYVKNGDLAKELLEVFYEDWNPSRTDISQYSPENYPLPPDYQPSALEPDGYYDAPFESLEMSGDYSITSVLSPDTSLDEGTIIGMIREAQESILIEQFYIVHEWSNGRTNPYLDEVVEAARRGVEIRVLLDDSEYNVEPEDVDNEDIIGELNSLAKSEGLNLEAKMIDSSSHGLQKLHNKGMIVDNRKTLISSINWNHNSITQNREVGLIVESEEVADYFKQVFLYDWKDDVDAPIARGCNDITVLVGEEVIFDGSKSHDSSSMVFEWDFDGDRNIDSRAPIYRFKYDRPGLYHVELNVSDISGNYNVSTCTIEVLNEGAEESMNALTWVFYIMLISATISLIWYSRRFSRSREKPNK